MITKITLKGFKGQFREIDLSGRTVLSGPNGLGKSSVLESVIYAISGRVPSGKSKDEAAKFFPHTGGSVTIEADKGVITRGVEIVRDRKSVRVSEVFHSEGNWETNSALLDMTEFLGLSENKRREFVLDLVGAGEPDDLEDFEVEFGTEVAREIAGPAASIETIATKKGLDALPEDLAAIGSQWGRVWEEVLALAKRHKGSASELFQKIAEVAAELKNASRRAAARAKAAAQELSDGAMGASAAASQIDEARESKAAASRAIVAAKEAIAEVGELERELAETRREAGAAEKEHTTREKKVAEFSEITHPGDAPDLTPYDEKIAELETSFDVELALVTKGEALVKLRNEIDRLGAQIVDLEKTPVGELVEAWKELIFWARREGIQDRFERGDSAIEKVAADWKARIDALGRRRTEIAEEFDEGAKEPHKADRDLLDDLAKRLTATRKARETAGAEHSAAVRDFHAEMDRRAALIRSASEWSTRQEEAEKRVSRLEKALLEKTRPDLEALGQAEHDAAERLRKANEAAGAVEAYRRALANHETELALEAVWKATEAAAKRSRELYVARIVKPLVGDLDALLKTAGRTESAYLLLENERGRPVFDLGWIGEAPSPEGNPVGRRSLSALSGGEAVLFTAALAVTIARRARGRKILLIEADPLDNENLSALLRGLAKIDDPLELCLVATSTPVDVINGWDTIRFVRPKDRQADVKAKKKKGKAKEKKGK